MNRRLGWSVVWACLLGVGCGEESNTADSNAEPVDLKIGILVPLQEFQSSMQSRLNGATLAAEQINATDELSVSIVPVDYGERGQVVQPAADLLAAHSDLTALIGPPTSADVMTVANEVTTAAGILMLAPSATAPEISDMDDGGLIFRMVLSDAHQGTVAANYAYQTLGTTSAAVIYADDPYGRGIANAFATAFRAKGGTIEETLFISFPDFESEAGLEAHDFSAALQTIVDGQPALIYIAAESTETAKILNTISLNNLDIGYGPKFMTVGASRKSGMVQNAALSEGMYGTGGGGAPAYDSEGIAAYKSAYETRFGEPPASSGAVKYYEAVYMMAFATLSKNSTSAVNMASALIAMSNGGDKIRVGDFVGGAAKIKESVTVDLDGVTNPYDFDANGDPTSGTYAIWNVVERKISTVTSVSIP